MRNRTTGGTMRLEQLSRAAGLALLLGGFACAGNKNNNEVGAASDTTATTDQTQSGVTDSSGQSTLGNGVEKTRPDQGQPVTSKGDTINQGVDSTTARQGADTSGMRETPTHTSGMESKAGTSGMRSSTDTSSMRQPRDTSDMGDMQDSTGARH